VAAFAFNPSAFATPVTLRRANALNRFSAWLERVVYAGME
jgi:hypothetical protein